MADVIQVTAASDGTYLIAEVMMGGMAPPLLHTARDGAEMARKVRDLLECPTEDIPPMIKEAFARDPIVAQNSIMAILKARMGLAGDDDDDPDDDDDDDPGVGDPLDPGWLSIF